MAVQEPRAVGVTRQGREALARVQVLTAPALKMRLPMMGKGTSPSASMGWNRTCGRCGSRLAPRIQNGAEMGNGCAIKGFSFTYPGLNGEPSSKLVPI
jgi:hypothetical protein